MCCLVAYECCCTGTCSTAREGCRPLVKSFFFQIFCLCVLRMSSSVTITSTRDRHISPVSTPPAPEISLWLSFHIEPLRTVWIVCFQLLNCSNGVKKQPFAALSPCCFINTTKYTVEVFCDGTFSALLQFLGAQRPHFSFCTIYLHWWERRTTWTTVSPVNLHVFLSDNAECRENFNNLRHHAGLFGVNCSSQKKQASLISQDPLQSILWKRQWLGHLYSMRTLTLSEKMNITKTS